MWRSHHISILLEWVKLYLLKKKRNNLNSTSISPLREWAWAGRPESAGQWVPSPVHHFSPPSQWQNIPGHRLSSPWSPYLIIFDLILSHRMAPFSTMLELREACWEMEVFPNVIGKYHCGHCICRWLRNNFHSWFQLNSTSSNPGSNWDAVPPGIINGDLGPQSKSYTVELHFPTIIRPYGIP